MQMWVYIVRRLLLLIPVVIGVMTITFVLVSAIPLDARCVATLPPSRTGCAPMVPCGGTASNSSGALCRNPSYEMFIHKLGLDQPIPVQWGNYIYRSLTLDWGYTGANSNACQLYSVCSLPVATVLSWYLPYTLELAAISLLIILALAIPIGNYSAVYRNRPFDQGARVISFSGFAFPGFLLSLLVLFAATEVSGGFITLCGGFSNPFELWYGSWPNPNCLPGHVFPAWVGASNHFHSSPTGFPTVDAVLNGNWDIAWSTFYRMILPAMTIAFASVAGILRFVRNSMLEVMNQDFIRTARAKGVPERQVIKRHAGRNSLNVTITILGLTFAGFIGGFPITEDVFGLKGIGNLLVLSVQAPTDLGIIFASTLLFTFIVVAANIVVDVLYAYLDPRVRLG